ncbi:hypothetical protein Lesp01_04010 [Lentzea sp. NBRC 102530]|nr:hypothetical protein Lesp01_04010 [Lentzea sp. NBRC 102530]
MRSRLPARQRVHAPAAADVDVEAVERVQDLQHVFPGHVHQRASGARAPPPSFARLGFVPDFKLPLYGADTERGDLAP